MNCHGCKQKYDLQCADLSPKRFRKLNQEGKLKWRCLECKSKQPKVGNINTPLRPTQQSRGEDEIVAEVSTVKSNVTLRKKPEPPTLSSSRAVDYVTEEVLRDIWNNEMRQEMQTMLEATIKRTVSEQLKTIHNQCTGFQESILYVSTQYDDLKNEIVDLKKLLGSTSSELKCLKVENKTLKGDLSACMTRVKALEDESLKQQQWVRMQNVEITGIPEGKDEITSELVLKVTKHIGINIVPSDLEFAHRVQPRRAESASRARSVIVRLRERIVKDQIIAAARKHRAMTAKDLGIGSESSKIFVNEHLTKESKMLLNSCKQKAKEVNYKYIWTKNCRIYVRRNDTSPAIPINSSSDLLKIA